MGRGDQAIGIQQLPAEKFREALVEPKAAGRVTVEDLTELLAWNLAHQARLQALGRSGVDLLVHEAGPAHCFSGGTHDVGDLPLVPEDYPHPSFYEDIEEARFLAVTV